MGMMISKYTKDVLEEAVKTSISISDVVRKVTGATHVHGSMHKHIKSRIELYGIDTSHFLGRRWMVGKPINFKSRTDTEFVQHFLIENSPYINTHTLKHKLWGFGILERRCVDCGVEEIWNDKFLTLQLDHDNGIRTDNRLENLKIRCPNCHSQTDTYSGRHNKLKN